MLAKEPVAGRVKTRLCPPCTPAEAAEIAAACLADTLDAALGAGADRVLLALDGEAGPWCPPGIEVVDQGGGGLDERLARAWSHSRGPAVQIGMDTPHVGAGRLAEAMALVDAGDADAVLGPAVDGGWWLAGMAEPRPSVFRGIPTSRADTGRAQLRAFLALGWETALLEPLTDVDTWADARAVAAVAPRSAFAAAVAQVREP